MEYINVNFPTNYKISSINYFENVNLFGVKTLFKYVLIKSKLKYTGTWAEFS